MAPAVRFLQKRIESKDSQIKALKIQLKAYKHRQKLLNTMVRAFKTTAKEATEKDLRLYKEMVQDLAKHRGEPEPGFQPSSDSESD